MTEKPYHILMMSSWYPTTHQPFTGNFVQRQAQLIATIHHVTVIHTISHPTESAYRIEKKVSGNLTEILVYHPRAKSLLTKLSHQHKALDMALKDLKKVDLLLSSVMLPKGVQFSRVKNLLGCPWVHIEHGSYFRKAYWKTLSLAQRIIISRSIKRMDAIYVVSEQLKQDVLSHFPRLKIGVLPNHIDTDLFKFEPKNPSEIKKFLHISTLEDTTKNPKGMLDACKLLVDKGIFDFHLTIISDEPYAKWESVVEDYDISNQVAFDGPFDWEELPRWYQQSDAFILNSNYETFSIVIAESWSTGTPVISTPVGIAANIPKELGIQTKVNDPTSLASAMEKIINDTHSFHAPAISAAAQQFSSKQILAQLETIIDTYVR